MKTRQQIILETVRNLMDQSEYDVRRTEYDSQLIVRRPPPKKDTPSTYGQRPSTVQPAIPPKPAQESPKIEPAKPKVPVPAPVPAPPPKPTPVQPNPEPTPSSSETPDQPNRPSWIQVEPWMKKSNYANSRQVPERDFRFIGDGSYARVKKMEQEILSGKNTTPTFRPSMVNPNYRPSREPYR